MTASNSLKTSGRKGGYLAFNVFYIVECFSSTNKLVIGIIFMIEFSYNSVKHYTTSIQSTIATSQ